LAAIHPYGRAAGLTRLARVWASRPRPSTAA
jgi:hypothetical protein